MEFVGKYIIRFVVLMLLQILVFNNIPAIGMISPYLYVAFILLLPVSMSPSLVLLMAFATGFIIDLSINSLGVHASAMTMMAVFRPKILDIMAPRIGYEANNEPLMSVFGFGWAARYTLACVAIHHIMLYFCFTFTVENISFMFVKVLINIILTVLIILITEKFIIKK